MSEKSGNGQFTNVCVPVVISIVRKSVTIEGNIIKSTCIFFASSYESIFQFKKFEQTINF